MSGQSPGANGAAPSSSWRRVLVIALGSSLVAGLAAWWVVARDGTQPAGESVAQASRSPSPTPSVAGPTRQAQAAQRTKPAYDGPPKITVQLGESKTEDCPAVFTESIVVRVFKGEAESITAVAKVPADKVTRTRELFEIDSEWSTMIGALPTKRTIDLLVIAKGPGGKTTIAQDISHPCVGEPMDEPDPSDLSSRKARKQIRDQMFSGGYDFDFDGSDKQKSGENG